MGIRPTDTTPNNSQDHSGGCCCMSCCGGEASKPPCVRLKVKLISLYVAKSECYDGLFGEAGTSAEWDFNVSVNGQTYNFYFGTVTDNSTQFFPANQEIFVDLAASGLSTLTISTSGVEKDDFFWNLDDPLPGAITTFGSGTNYELDKTLLLTASSECFNYTLYFQVSCLSVQYSAIQKIDYLGQVRTWMANAGLPPEPNDNLVISAASNRIMKKRFSEMMAPCTDTVWFQGPEPIQTSLDAVFPLAPPPPPPAPTPGFPPYQPS